MNFNFIKGFLYGAVFIVFIGLIWGQMSKARNTIKKRNKPLDTFPEADQPNLTPAKIVRKSLWAMFAWIFWLLILAAFILLMAVIVEGELMGG